MLAFPVLDYAQDNTTYEAVPVEISEVRTQKDGVWYYVHKVLPRQTMYSICRAYDVTQQEVYDANKAALETGLKAGMDLLIPYHEGAESKTVAPVEPVAPVVQKVEETAPQQQPADEFTIHRVKWYESLYSIARKYEITPESIIRANRLTRTDLATGQTLKIPTTWQKTLISRLLLLTL